MNEVEKLREENSSLKAELNFLRRGHKCGAGVVAVVLFGPRLIWSIRDWMNATSRERPVPLDETANLAAAIIRRMLSIGVIGLVFASLIPTWLLWSQNQKFDIQNELIGKQNQQIGVQNRLLNSQNQMVEVQNALAQSQNQKTDAQNQLFENQNQKIDTQNELASTQNLRMAAQNELIKKQNQFVSAQSGIMGRQNELVEGQNKLIEDQNTLYRDQNQALIDQSKKEAEERVITRRSQLLEIIYTCRTDGNTCVPIAHSRARKEAAEAFLRIAQQRGESVDLSGAPLGNTGFMIHREHLYDAVFVDADLSWAFLRQAVLPRADFSNANLSHANIRQAHLIGADFPGAVLNNARMDHCELELTDFFGASLERVDLSGADLSFAYLSNANLMGADLTETDLTGTILDGADLRKTKGLTQSQLESSLGGDDSTRIPPHLKIPDRWKNSSPDNNSRGAWRLRRPF